MTYEICPICGEENTGDHGCLSYDSLKYSLELDFLGLSNELIEPYNIEKKPEHGKTANEPKLYDLTKEIEYASPLRVSEPHILSYVPGYSLIGNAVRRNIPLFLQL